MYLVEILMIYHLSLYIFLLFFVSMFCMIDNTMDQHQVLYLNRDILNNIHQHMALHIILIFHLVHKLHNNQTMFLHKLENQMPKFHLNHLLFDRLFSFLYIINIKNKTKTFICKQNDNI